MERQECNILEFLLVKTFLLPSRVLIYLISSSNTPYELSQAMETNLTSIPTLRTEGSAQNNDEIQFVVTSAIHYTMQKYCYSGICPVIVLNHHLPRAWTSLSHKGLHLCGSVFLKWNGLKLERLSDFESELPEFELPESLKNSIQANWNHFEKNQYNTLASYVETVPIHTVRKIDDNCFEFSTPKTKWAILGSQNMVVVNLKENKPKFASKCLNSLHNILARVSEIDDHLLKCVGIPMTINIKEKFGLSDSDTIYILFGIMIIWHCFDMSKHSRCLKGGVFIIAVGSYFWPLLCSEPVGYLLCMFLCMCAILGVRTFV